MTSTMRGLSVGLLLSACVFITSVTRLAEGVTINWQQPGGGDLTVGGNWQGGSAPTSVDDAVFALAGVNNFFANTNLTYNSALFRAGDNTLAMGTSTLTLNDVLTLGDTTTPVSLTLTSGQIAVNGLFPMIGAASGSDATLIMDGGSLTVAEFFRVGELGTGSLSILNGGTVQALDTQSNTNVANGVGSTGSLIIDGVGSTFDGNAAVVIGFSGDGMLQITNGGVLNTANGSVGAQATSNSSAVISGSGSAWNNAAAGNAKFSVGGSGIGSLTIDNGASFTNDGTDIGNLAGSQGTVVVDGLGSTLIDTSELFVGEGGTGTMTVSNQGAVSVGFILIVSEEGTSTGELNIESGGQVTVGSSTIIGDELGSNGTLNVDGLGSLLDSTGTVAVGFDGTGTINVTNGGSVISDNRLVVGLSAPGSGSVVVDGAGSSITVVNDVELGTNGPATLEIRNGGLVSSATGEFDTAASITVTDANSQFTMTGDVTNLAGGGFADAVVSIANGGAMSNADSNWGGNTTVTVDGIGSQWTNNGHMRFNVGTLTVTGGGLVTANLATFSSNLGGSPSRVSGAGSTLQVTGPMFFADSGTASLVVEAGGQLSTNSVSIGDNGSASGSITVTGAGSAWTDAGDLLLGFDGSGAINVLDGGAANLGNVSIAAFTGSSGSIFMDDAGSTLTADDISVGGDGPAAGGTGVMEVRDGTATIGDLLVLAPGTLTLSGGSLHTSSLDASAGVFSHTDGLLEVSGGALAPNAGGVADDYVINGPTAVELPRVQLVGGATTTVGRDLFVGDSNRGELTVDSGSTVSNVRGIIGHQAGAIGAVTVDGVGSVWTNSSQLFIGHDGTGTLDILGGGVVTSTADAIGFQPGSIGTVTVDGSGSQWTNAGQLRVGNLGTGTLNVQNGGAVFSQAGVVADDPSGIGTVTVDGTNSEWQITNDLTVGNFGDGTLNIQNGGVVSNVTSTLAAQSGSSAEVIVDGPNSDWTNTGQIFVGSLGTATVAVTNGGTVSGSGEALGFQAGSLGDVTINGAGSQWTSSGLFRVGNFGTGVLRVEQGGTLLTDLSVLGDDPGSSGSVDVTGTDGFGNPASWINYGTLTIGNAGNGNLFVSQGGLVESTAADLASQATAQGSASISGTNGLGLASTWTVQGFLTIGDQGTGTLHISDGAFVSSDGATIASNLGSIGNVTVTGAGSLWDIPLNGMFIGEVGDASLTIESGGAVQVSSVTIGQTGSGTLTVDGAGSLWSNGNSIVVGQTGTGSLTITSGGSAFDNFAIVGQTVTGSGIVLVSDSGSLWNIAASLDIGGGLGLPGGAGIVTVQNEGRIEVGGLINIWETGEVNIYGGTLAFESLSIDPNASFNFIFGTLHDLDNTTIEAGDSLRQALGGAHEVTIGQELRVEGTTTLLAPLAINGGVFSTGNLVNAPLLQFNNGILNLTQADLTVGFAGPFGPILTVAAGQELNVTNTTAVDGDSLLIVEDGGRFSAGTLNNSGELSLGGRLAIVTATTTNNTGLLRGDGRVNGPVSNAGAIEAIDQPGELIFTGPVANETTGLVAVRNSAVRFSQGLSNNGQLSFGPGNADFFGDLTNDDTIGLSSGATVSVVGDVVQNSTLNLLSNSHLIVFDDFSGPGGTTGPGTLEVLGTLSPGASPAEVDFGGDLIVGASTLIELGGTANGQFDRLVVAGELTLNGQLDVVLIDGFTPTLGDTFQIATAASILGGFASQTLPDLGALLAMQTVQDSTTVTLFVAPVLAGDYNADGTVNLADYTVWRDTLGASGIGSAADGDGSGTVDVADYGIWRTNFGNTIGALSTSQSAVPEPATCGLLAASALCLMQRSRNARRCG